MKHFIAELNMEKKRIKKYGRLSSLTEKISDELELPKTVVPGTVHIEMNGNREAIVDGCRGIVEYDENIIRLNTGKYIVRFTGEGLMIKTLSLNQALVCGNITSIDFTT